MPELVFTTEQENQMFSEGWGVFEVDTDKSNLQIQKLDESDVFGSDQQAWAFVVEQVQKGSLLHADILYYFKENRPSEYALYTQGVDLDHVMALSKARHENRVMVNELLKITPEQERQILAEGWGVFDVGFCIRSGKHVFPATVQLQKYGLSERFEGDPAAWAFVVEQAKQGSALHRQILAYFKENNPSEYTMYTNGAEVDVSTPA